MALDQGKAISPPGDLHSRALRLKKIQPKDWSRIFNAELAPCYYAPSEKNRFSSSKCSVLYLGDKAVTAFWETWWDDLGTLPEDQRLISARKLNAREICSASAKRAFRVFDATNARSLKSVSAATGTFTADYIVCQAWAVALLGHPQKPEGILYPSARHAGGKCLALFEGRTDCSDIDFLDPIPLKASPTIRALLSRERIGVL